ncbi:hypothetical protein J4421_05950 [Candidatus Woesearchaeota archaeon]|nr:hypothetical protein [Candidatus Woesearchaeota archaeon]
MKSYIKEAVQQLQQSSKLKKEIELKNPNDYKKNFLRISYNKLLFFLQTRIVPSHFKNWLLRTSGMNIGDDACIPHYIKFDPYFPELIYLEKGSLVGGLCTLVTHKIEGNKLLLGKVILEERTMIGGDCIMFPGSKVSKKSLLMFFSDLNKVIPEGELWGGKPAQGVKKFSSEEIEKFFALSKNDSEYYKSFKKKVREFLHDPTKTYLKIQYNGKRLTAGNDWWRARNMIRIFWNGGITEITRPLPHCRLKTTLLRLAGIKIGKNCHIGKGVIFDHLFGDNVTLEDNVTLGENAYLDGHEYTTTQTIFGKTVIKKGAHIKHHAFIRTGTIIGENTIIEPFSVAQREIPSNEIWGGNPAVFLKKKA